MFDRLAAEILLLWHIASATTEHEHRERHQEDCMSHLASPLGYSMAAVESPSALVPMAHDASRSGGGGDPLTPLMFRTKRTEPSPKRKFAPPVWKLEGSSVPPSSVWPGCALIQLQCRRTYWSGGKSMFGLVA